MTDPSIDPSTGRRPAGSGRPTLLTDEVRDRIVQVVNAGNYLKTAAQFVGVGQSTLLGWLARGRAASAQVDAHADTLDHRRCPSCDHDREDEVRSMEQADAEAEAAYRAELEQPRTPDSPEPVRAYAVLDRCPQCRSTERPRPWELPAEEARYLTFLEQVTRAETNAEVAAVTHWRAAFSQDWRAARDYLARKRPDQWAAKTTVAISGEEAEQRIERATLEALTALGVDLEGMDLADLDDAADLSGEAPAPLEF